MRNTGLQQWIRKVCRFALQFSQPEQYGPPEAQCERPGFWEERLISCRLRIRSHPYEKLFVTHGMQRGGQHAIINWICSELDDVAFLNHVGVRSGRLVPLYGRTLRFHQGTTIDSGHANYESYLRDTADAPARRFALIGIEDSDLDSWDVSDDKNERHVLIVRDLYNWLASRLTYDRRRRYAERLLGGEYYRFLTRRWARLVRACLEDDNRLVAIDFGRWRADTDYAAQSASRIGFAYSGRGREKVLKIGGGSTFERRRFDGSASQMAIDERWRTMAHDPFYRSLLAPEYKALNEAYFGIPCPRELSQ